MSQQGSFELHHIYIPMQPQPYNILNLGQNNFFWGRHVPLSWSGNVKSIIRIKKSDCWTAQCPVWSPCSWHLLLPISLSRMLWCSVSARAHWRCFSFSMSSSSYQMSTASCPWCQTSLHHSGLGRRVFKIVDSWRASQSTVGGSTFCFMFHDVFHDVSCLFLRWCPSIIYCAWLVLSCFYS